jgi:Glycosyltransferase family 87
MRMDVAPAAGRRTNHGDAMQRQLDALVTSDAGLPVPAWPARVVGIIRDMAWLDAERARAYAVLASLAWMAMVALIIRAMHGGLDVDGHLFGGDFASFWAASRLVLTGWAPSVYIPAVHYLAQLPTTTLDFEAFYYPPPYLLLCAPLSLLPFFPSLIIFQVLTGGAYCLTLCRILGSNWALAAAFASPAAALNIIAGQNAFLTTAILGSGLTCLDRRPRLAGALLGLMVIKPHLAVIVPLALILWRQWTTLAWAGATATGLVALSGGVFGWDVWAGFLEHARVARTTLEDGSVGYGKMQSAFALARSLGVGQGIAYVIQAFIVAVAAGSLIWARRRMVPVALQRSLIVVAGLLSTPFLLHYDILILILPLGWMLRHWIDTGFPPWSKLVGILTLCGPAIYVFRGPLSFGAPVLLVFGASVLWPANRMTGTRRYVT